MPEPDDYIRLDGVQVTFTPGEFTKTVTLETVDDGIAEGDEYFNATVSAVDPRVTVFEPAATITIRDNGSYILMHANFKSKCQYTLSTLIQMFQQYSSQLRMLLWEKEMEQLKFVSVLASHSLWIWR